MLLVPSGWFVVVALHSGHTIKKINLTIKGRNVWVLTSAFIASNSWSLKADRCKVSNNLLLTCISTYCTVSAAFITCSMKLANCNQRLASFPGPTQPGNKANWRQLLLKTAFCSASDKCLLYCTTGVTNLLLQKLSSESSEKRRPLCCSAFPESLWKPAFSGSPLK